MGGGIEVEAEGKMGERGEMEWRGVQWEGGKGKCMDYETWVLFFWVELLR